MKSYKVSGNGTASRSSESYLKDPKVIAALKRAEAIGSERIRSYLPKPERLDGMTKEQLKYFCWGFFFALDEISSMPEGGRD